MDKRRILICDDEEIIRESTKAYLEDDFDISLAEDAHQAIDSVKDKDFDLIIMDIKMGGLIDGVDAIREIKKLKPGQKIIVLTGYLSMDDNGALSKLGICAYLVKPVGRAKLLEVIGDALK